MPIIKTERSMIDETNNALHLARYAQIVQYPEDQFWGINNPLTLQASCKPIWTYPERQLIARYLGEAQEEIEKVAHYPMAPRWFADEVQPYSPILRTKWLKVQQIGVRATSTIQAGVAVSHVTDPAVIGPVVTTVTDPDEIAVYHPGTTIPIDPSEVTIAGGAVTIQVPRCRLIKAASVYNPSTGYAYADIPPSVTSPYEATVDIGRVYNDPSTEGVLVWPHVSSADCTCSCSPCNGTCADYREDACLYIQDSDMGLLDATPASQSGGAWTVNCPTCYCTDPSSVRINYQAGALELTAQMEDAIVRLAHAKMPKTPCGCGVANEMWTRDRFVPPVLDAVRLQCPFGLSDGAWIAYTFAKSLRLQRAAVIR